MLASGHSVRLGVPTHLDSLLLHRAQAGPPQWGQTEEWTCPSLLPLLLCLPPSTSPPRPPLLLCLLIYLPSPQACCPIARPALCNSSLPTHSSESPEGQTPHPSPSHLRAKKKKKERKRRGLKEKNAKTYKNLPKLGWEKSHCSKIQDKPLLLFMVEKSTTAKKSQTFLTHSPEKNMTLYWTHDWQVIFMKKRKLFSKITAKPTYQQSLSAIPESS